MAEMFFSSFDSLQCFPKKAAILLSQTPGFFFGFPFPAAFCATASCSRVRGDRYFIFILWRSDSKELSPSPYPDSRSILYIHSGLKSSRNLKSNRKIQGILPKEEPPGSTPSNVCAQVGLFPSLGGWRHRRDRFNVENRHAPVRNLKRASPDRHLRGTVGKREAVAAKVVIFGGPGLLP